MKDLFSTIEQAITEIGHGWTSVDKGQAMAAMVLAIRPQVSVEIGVYAGKGLVSMALAHKAIGIGKVIGIDPFTAEDSIEGQIHPADKEFWGRVDYAAMEKLCLSTLDKYGASNFFELIRKRSDDADVPPAIGVLRIDGNHGEAAFRDVKKWTPAVSPGGFVIIDDIGWTGGATTRAAAWISGNGFRMLYKLDDGFVFQKP